MEKRGLRLRGEEDKLRGKCESLVGTIGGLGGCGSQARQARLNDTRTVGGAARSAGRRAGTSVTGTGDTSLDKGKVEETRSGVQRRGSKEQMSITVRVIA